MSDQVEIPNIDDLPDMQETAEFSPVVKLLTTETPVLGYDGTDINPANWQAKALADRTQWLRDRLLSLSTRLVMSVNGQTGNVVVTYNDVGADGAGTADALMTAHLTALDPHSQYFDETRGDARYVQRSLANQSNGWLQLDASGKIPAAMLTVLASRYVVVANQAARLALASSANLTICAQADVDQLFYLNGGANPAVAANWVAGQSATVSGVSSVYGRTGAVTAQNGDYDADKITETATRKFASPTEKTTWNAKQAVLVSGTNIRSLFGQSLLGGGNLAPTPAQMGSAATVHTHTTADITDYTQKTQQLITASLEAGPGVTLGYNPVSGKTIISAAGGSGGGSNYIVVDRQGAGAGQLHTFNISTQSAFNLAAFALKEEAGTTNVTVLVDDFNASSEKNYETTSAMEFDGQLTAYSGGTYYLQFDGEFCSSPVKSDGAAINIVAVNEFPPEMTSNTTSGYHASASSTFDAGYPAYCAFDKKSPSSTSMDCWASIAAPTIQNAQWLRIDMPNPIYIGSYKLRNRVANQMANPRSWILQGSNDGAAWSNLHSVDNDLNNSSGAVREFNIPTPAAYRFYRLFITAANGGFGFVTVGELTLFNDKKLLISDGRGNWYSSNNGTLIRVTTPKTDGDFRTNGFNDSGHIDEGEINDINQLSIVSFKEINANVLYFPHAQLAIQLSLTSASSWSQINSATLTATQTGNGKVRVAVTRDLVSWHVLRNGAWVDVGTLSADTAGAEALIADGMTPAELGGITAAQWTQLFSSNNGVPDSLAFAFAFDITNPSADVAAIDRLLLNVNNTSSWRLQSPAEVEIRWRNDNVTFRNIASGNYKLAYQIP
ncbi:discoidin domain-containing protein [Pectobacterium versatile]|uniref:discoidin domain-containing protein n=1 Tax=Pectobacterium versatile TaxID=2488639 RepID=UPI001CF262DE|nr:discoidin domain-containing protein [Pectobacterium versatile]MCA6927927.1 discoidin domain-containing protein [Pectobacterium versatile]MCH5084671.1 discoidin domain-containing protein [Pectobacterium versatile]